MVTEPKFDPQVLPPLKWERSPNQSSRSGARVRLIIPHTCEGTYEGTISWFKNEKADASSHIVVDRHGTEATQMVGYSQKAWTQAFFNPVCISLELAGWIRPNPLKGQFGHSWRQCRRTARMVAFLLKENNLPPHFVPNSERFSGKGYTLHGFLAPEGGHPFCKVFSGLKLRMFKRWVRREFERGHFRREWGRA